MTVYNIDGTAKGEDYRWPGSSATYRFTAADFALEGGKYVQTVTRDAEIIDDALVERTEFFELQIDETSLPSHVSVLPDPYDNTAIIYVEIHDNDRTTVGFTTETIRVTEGEGLVLEDEEGLEIEGLRGMVVPVVVHGKLVTFPFTVVVTLVSGTAEPDHDYIQPPRPVTYSALEEEGSTIIKIVDDGVAEADETFVISLLRNGLEDSIDLQPVRATVTIVDDDHAPVIAKRQPDVAVGRAEVGRLRATDADEEDTLIWSLIGGADQGLFELTEDGLLSLKTARTALDDPGDANGDGRYELEVQVTDGYNPRTVDLSLPLELDTAPTAPSGFRWERAGDEGRRATLTWGAPADDGNWPVLRYEYERRGGGGVANGPGRGRRAGGDGDGSGVQRNARHCAAGGERDRRERPGVRGRAVASGGARGAGEPDLGGVVAVGDPAAGPENG